VSNGYKNERQERRELPATGFRFYDAKPEFITANMVILVDDMIQWLQNEKASGLKKNEQGKEVVRLSMRETKEGAKTSHWLAYDDYEPKEGGQQPRNNVTPMPATSIPEDDIPF
jgi:hypothetical protein